MTKSKFEEMSFDELMEYAYSESYYITTEEALKDYAIYKLNNDDFGMALHIINAIYENPFNTKYYRYDYSMGRLETPTPLTDKSDIDDLIFFDDEE